MDMFDMGDGFDSLLDGIKRVKCPVLILGVTSDVLFPIEQQREMNALLKEAGTYMHTMWSCHDSSILTGNKRVTYYELSSIYGHDTFLLDVNNVGVAIKVGPTVSN